MLLCPFDFHATGAPRTWTMHLVILTRESLSLVKLLSEKAPRVQASSSVVLAVELSFNTLSLVFTTYLIVFNKLFQCANIAPSIVLLSSHTALAISRQANLTK